MDHRIIEKITARYHRVLDDKSLVAKRSPTDVVSASPDAALAHARVMLSDIDQFILDDRIEKAMRWIGFVQGVLWVNQIFTIDEMIMHNLGQFED